MFGKPAFGTGAPTTSFGFGTATASTANPFGTGQLFGKPAGAFGSPSTSAFGQPANTSVFPSSQPQPNALFQNAATGFGTPASTPSTGFGTTTLFGQQQPATGGLFNTTSTFGQQNKPAAFGFGTQPAQPTLFGQQAAQPQTSGIFQPSTSNLFGSTSAFGQQATGTGGVKFNPVTGTDTMLKAGVSNSINTKLHSITCMKDYESKSFEELRCEDYAANRKGPQQQTGFGTTPFGNQVSSAPSLFPDASKPAFSGFGQQNTTTFGQNTGFGMPNQQQQTGGLFGKPATGFATPTSTPSLNFGFGSNTQTNIPFGAAQQPKTFGSVTPSIFGTNTATTQQSGFNTGGGIFGQTSTQNTAGSIFGKPAQPTVGFGNTSNTSFSFSTPASTQAPSLFQPNKPLFGQTSTTPAFGQTTNTFGSNTFGSTLGKPAAPAFGATPTPAFGNTLGTGLQPQAAPLFGNNAVKPGGFFGNTGSTGLGAFQSNTFQTNTGFNLQPQPAQQSLFPSAEQQSSANLALLTADPFGDAPHLAGLEPKLKITSTTVSATDPKELKSLLDASNKVITSTGSKLRVIPIRNIKDSLFDASTATAEENKDYIKTNCRKLVLKNRPNSGESNTSAAQRMDILKHIDSSQSPINDENVNTQNIRYNTLQNEIRPSVKLNFENSVNCDTNLPALSQSFQLNNSLTSNSHETIQKNNRISVEVETEPTDPRGSGDCLRGYPCSIICTRPEYYTLPPPEELTKYIDEDGRCIVKGFTIGRKGYGNVYFPEEMDVSALNVDELVHFRYREINIYPDDEKKPPVGQGLNRKAQVTLDNVYPKRPGSNTLVKDINELQLMNFSEKLRKITENKDAKFVDYRPETGSWVFKVEHFSRYGYDESDDESVPSSKETAEKKAAEKTVKADIVPPNKPTEKQLEKEAVAKMTPSKSQITKFGLDDDIFVEEGAHDLYVQPEDDLIETAMYVDNISEDDYHVIPTDLPLHLTHDQFASCKNIQVMKSTLFADDDRSSDGGGSHISIIRQYLDIPEDIRRLPVLREECPPKKKIMLRPKVDKVYNFAKKETSNDLMQIRSYQDMGIFRGRSFKVGWSKGFNFYNAVSKPEGGFQLTFNDIKCGSRKEFDAIDEILDKSLQIVFEESSYDIDCNNIPTFTIIKNHAYLKRQSNLFSTLLQRYNTKETKYLHSIWTLADSLWGPSENTISNRRHLLSEWLTINTNYDEPSQEPAQEIFNNLSVFKINEAANLALDKRFPNLSLIISQLSVTNRTKLFIQEQIESWYQSMSSNHISEDMKKIYLLLSGIPVKDEVNIFENIDWKRAFGMHMWYVSPLGAPIEMVIELYKKAFEEYNYAQMPNPPYESNYAEENSFDLLYHILVLYQSRAHRLSTVLNSATHTENHLDYWLSWLLLQLFLSLDVGIMDDAEKNKLCNSFSNQLESLGEWEWSIFVLLYLKDNPLKKTLVMQILDRNLSPDVDKEGVKSENNLVNNMHIPPEWIHHVKGEKTLLCQRHFEAFNHFAYSKDYCTANDILVEHLLPSLFVNEQYDIIKILIREIEDGSAQIEHWNSEAGLFKDFIELQERYVSASDNLKLQMNLQNISNRIANFIPKTNHQKLCIAEMSKRCASVYKEFCKKSQSNLFRNSYLEFIESLNMPPEFKQNEALYSINEIGATC